MDIPIKAKVTCEGEDCGQITCIIVNPQNDELTHVVVESSEFPFKERVVPVEFLKESTSKTVMLSCNKEQFQKMRSFIEHHYIPADKAYGIFPIGQKVYIPYSVFSNDFADVTRERIPDGGIAFHPGTIIEAKDGKVGKVVQFLVDPATEHITHLVMKEGHLWNKKEVAIPASVIDRIEKDRVVLRLTRHQLEKLPAPA